MEANAITFHLPNKEKQSIIFEIQINVSVPAGGYSKHKRINMNSMALVDTGATGSCISRRLAESAQLKAYKRTKIRGFNGISIVPVYNLDH